MNAQRSPATNGLVGRRTQDCVIGGYPPKKGGGMGAFLTNMSADARYKGRYIPNEFATWWATGLMIPPISSGLEPVTTSLLLMS